MVPYLAATVKASLLSGGLW